MEKTTMEQISEIRNVMPSGFVKEVTCGNKSKAVLLYRMFKKEKITEMTHGELEMLNEFLKYAAKAKKDNKELEKKIEKITQQ